MDIGREQLVTVTADQEPLFPLGEIALGPAVTGSERHSLQWTGHLRSTLRKLFNHVGVGLKDPRCAGELLLSPDHASHLYSHVDIGRLQSAALNLSISIRSTDAKCW